MSRGPTTHAEALGFLGKLPIRKLASGTLVVRGSRESGDVHVVHDRTAIISFHADGTFSLSVPADGPIGPARDRWSKFLRAAGYSLKSSAGDPRLPVSEENPEWVVTGSDGSAAPLNCAFRLPVLPARAGGG